MITAYSIVEMRLIAFNFLNTLRAQLQNKGRITPKIIIVVGKGRAAMKTFELPFKPELLNQPERLFHIVSRQAQQSSADLVVVLSDGHALEMDAEQEQRLKLPEEQENYHKAVAEGGIILASEMGFGTLVHSALVMVQGPLWQVAVGQHYQRLGAERDSIVFGRIEEGEMDKPTNIWPEAQGHA